MTTLFCYIFDTQLATGYSTCHVQHIGRIRALQEKPITHLMFYCLTGCLIVVDIYSFQL